MPITPRSIRTLAAVSTAVLAVLVLALHLSSTQASHDPGAMANDQSGVVQIPLASGEISGAVTDGQGQPIGGASVVAQGACSPCGTYTTSDGSFAFPDLPPGPYTLFATVGGHQPRFWTSSGGTTERASAESIEVITGATAIADFTLPGYTTISGQVTNRDGEAIAVAFVSAQNLEIGGAFSSETDASGHYEISLEQAGPYRLAVATSDYLFMFWTSSGGVHNYLEAEPIPVPDVIEETLTGYDIALPRLSTISGRVTDNAENPISNIAVSPHSRADYCFQCPSGQTDVNGEYRLTVEPGRYWVFIQGGLFRDEWWNSSGGGTREEVAVGLEEDVRVSDVQLSRLGIITGTVRDQEGHFLQGADVTATGSPCCSQNAVTDENGQYTMIALLPGDYTLSAALTGYRTGYWTSAGSVMIPDGAEPVGSGLDTVVSGIDLTLLPKGSISGRLTDIDGNGIAGANLVASASDFQCCEFWWAPTDDDGHYSIIDLETGDYKLAGNPSYGFAAGFYTSSGGTTEMAQAEPVHVELGAETSGVNFHLLRHGAIAGRVTDVAGNPIAGAEVRTYLPECGWCTAPSTLTEGDGYYSFVALEPTDHLVLASAQGYVPQFWSSNGGVARVEDATTIYPGLEDVITGINLHLPRPASIRGRVVDSSGNPLAGATVSLSIVDCQGCSAGYQTNYDGEYSISSFPPGEITLVAYKGGYTSMYWTSDGGSPWQPEVLSVADGAQLAGYDFTLRMPGFIHGFVSDLWGAPSNGARVEVLGDSCSPCSWAYTSPVGEYWLRMPVGEYRVSASYGGFVSEFWTASGGTSDVARTMPVKVTEGATTDGINFHLLPLACAPYDVTGDTTVNVLDIVAVARAMGSRPGRHRWNPDADVNDDGRVNGRDLALVLRAFRSRDCR